jgi:hypothetical protein
MLTEFALVMRHASALHVSLLASDCLHSVLVHLLITAVYTTITLISLE